jgi:hypothetical protein
VAITRAAERVIEEDRQFESAKRTKTRGEMQVHWSRVLSTPAGFFPPDADPKKRRPEEEEDLKVGPLILKKKRTHCKLCLLFIKDDTTAEQKICERHTRRVHKPCVG